MVGGKSSQNDGSGEDPDDNRTVIRVIARRRATDGFVAVDPDDIGDAADYDLIWVDFSEQAHAEPTLLDELGLGHIANVDGPSFGLTEAGNALRMSISSPEVGDSARLEVDRVGMVLTRSVMVTGHDDPVPVIDRLWDPTALDALEVGSPAALAAVLTQSATRQTVPLIDELEVRIDSLEDLAFAADPKTLAEVHVLRRELITLRRIATRQRDTASDAAHSTHGAIGAAGREAFLRAAGDAVRVVDSLETARSMLSSALETYRGAVADETNDIVRLLTVFSAILLPLTLITGLFGMNFVTMPTTAETWGFWVWIGVMAVVAVGLWTFFVRRGFIGGESLRDLPKSVGLGLVQVGTAPVRAIASGVESTIQHLDPRRRNEDED